MVWTIAFPQKADAAVLGKDIREGDVLSLEAGSWSENYAVLIPDTTNIGTEGTFLMMDGFKEKIMHDETGRSNLWEGSTSQQWCTNYYRKLPDAVSSKIIGVKTTDTESRKRVFGAYRSGGPQQRIQLAAAFSGIGLQCLCGLHRCCL